MPSKVSMRVRQSHSREKTKFVPFHVTAREKARDSANCTFFTTSFNRRFSGKPAQTACKMLTRPSFHPRLPELSTFFPSSFLQVYLQKRKCPDTAGARQTTELTQPVSPTNS